MFASQWILMSASTLMLLDHFRYITSMALPYPAVIMLRLWSVHHSGTYCFGLFWVQVHFKYLSVWSLWFRRHLYGDSRTNVSSLDGIWSTCPQPASCWFSKNVRIPGEQWGRSQLLTYVAMINISGEVRVRLQCVVLRRVCGDACPTAYVRRSVIVET